MDKDVKAIDTGGPAFPLPGFTAMVCGKSETLYAPVDGMTLRDYFAAAALAHPRSHQSKILDIAVDVYEIADAMLAQRAKAST